MSTAHFIPPQIQDNPNGWGPNEIPEQFKDMPYQPFSKDVRLGKVSDWTGSTYQDKRYLGKYNSAFGGGSQYAYYHEEDESTFQLVDTSRVQKPVYQRRGRLFQQNRQRRDRERRQQQTQASMQVLTKTQKNRERDRQRILKKWQKQFGKQMQENRSKMPIRNRDASVQIKDDWVVVEEMDFPRLTKLNLPDIKDGEDL
ncbi:eukaryotic translation initiation factor 3 subunit D [Elysia marginata]|uniref:Eukaryotic translation initiation factor 3 subunit D n=1 Tax=Elysia marginata TaxID=1093978 RepID=A0AAV4II76_9GAST|nr:eukaryotic translation initiation factor 3 subunit D [Elysia marginata]